MKKWTEQEFHANTLLRASIPPSGWFVTGSDTDVGKTEVAVLFLRNKIEQGISVGAYKPVASGIAQCVPLQTSSPLDSHMTSDVDRLWNAIERKGAKEGVCPQSFTAPLAPSLAAELEGRKVDSELLRNGAKHWYGKSDCLVVEGAGGLLSPISDHETNADLARALGYPLIVVVANRLGAVHQSLSTIAAARWFGLTLDRIVLNDVEPTDDSTLRNHVRLLADFAPTIFGALPPIDHLSHRGTQLRRVA